MGQIRELLLALALVLLALAPTHAQSVSEGIAAFERGDYESAIQNWRPLAEKGDPEAQINLAGMYFHGHGLERDLVSAHKWCDIAAGILPEGEGRLLALRLRSHVALQMSDEERAESAEQVAAWRAEAAE